MFAGLGDFWFACRLQRKSRLARSDSFRAIQRSATCRRPRIKSSLTHTPTRFWNGETWIRLFHRLRSFNGDLLRQNMKLKLSSSRQECKVFINPAANLGPRIQYHEVCYEVLGLGLLSIPRLSQNYTHSQFSVLLPADKHQKEKAGLFWNITEEYPIWKYSDQQVYVLLSGDGWEQNTYFLFGKQRVCSKKKSVLAWVVGME